jgi:hypothetical protein
VLILVLAIAMLIVAVTVIPTHKTLSSFDSTGSRDVMLFWRDGLVLKPLLLLVLALATILSLKWIPSRWAGVVLVGVVALDLLVAKPTFPLVGYSTAKDEHLQWFRQTITARMATTEPFRVDLAPNVVTPSATIGERVENVNGRWPMALRRFYRFVHWMRGMEPSLLQRHELPADLYSSREAFPFRVLNVRYASQTDLERRTIAVVQNPKYEPRAWVVDRAEVAPDEEAALHRMRDPRFDPTRVVLLENPPRINMASADSPVGTCRARKHENGDLDVWTQTTRDGYLVLSEIFYPGWRATVDGKEVPVERADYLITALPLPKGTHRVEYRYDPLSFKLGAACTAVMCVVGIIMLIANLRRKTSVS